MTEVPSAAGTRLRLARQARGLSQQQLAGMAAVTRQAVSAVESGHSDPSLRVALALASALGMTVEGLFGPGDPADPVLALPVAPLGGEGSRVTLATVGDTFVALPLRADTASRAGFGPAGGLIATTQARGLVAGPPARGVAPGTPAGEAREARGAREAGAPVPVRPIGPPRPTLIVAGCDPALPLLETPLALLDPPVGFAWWPCGNGEALRLAAAGLVHAAGVHQAGGPGDDLEIPGGAEVVGFTSWREGLVTRHQGRVTGLGDVARRGLRLVNREPGAQARSLLDRERLRLRLDPAELPGYDSQAAGHLQVAAAVAGRLADAGVSSEPAALSYGLDFLPLAEERFDLVLPAKHAASREVQGLLKVLTSPWLLAQLASLPGYDPARCGERSLLSVAVDGDQQRARDGAEPQVEACHGRRRGRLQLQAGHVERVHGEHVTVGRVAGRRGRAAEVAAPVVVPQVHRPRGQAGSAGVAGAGRQ
jgi:putative molybdopterin biosynthesis protein